MDEVFDLEFSAAGDAVLQAVGFEDSREDECGWGRDRDSHDTNVVEIKVLIARGFTLDVDGRGACFISADFPEPFEVHAVRDWLPASSRQEEDKRYAQNFMVAVRAKLGPALSAKYLNA